MEHDMRVLVRAKEKNEKSFSGRVEKGKKNGTKEELIDL